MARRLGVLDPETFPERVLAEDQIKWAKDYFSKHPGTAESLLPVWGPAREAIADAHDGDYVGAAGNGALAVADAIPALAAGRTVVRSAAYLNRFGKLTDEAANWKAVRKWMGDEGYFEKGQPAHHWIVEKNEGIGKQLPNLWKNGPWNLKGMPDAVTHGRIHHKWKDLPKYGPLGATIQGTPGGVKAAGVAAGAHGVGALAPQLDRRKP